MAMEKLLSALNSAGGSGYLYSRGLCQRVTIVSRFAPELMTPIKESDYLTVRNMRLPGMQDLLLAAAHMPSKREWSDADQVFGCVSLAEDVLHAERLAGHSRTLLVGDLNMNPFEDGIVSAKGLHGVMTQQIAGRRSRIIKGKKYDFFYNPMWGLFGDRNQRPAGTYYYTKSVPKAYFWNMFDQVMVRPDLLERFPQNELAILDHDGMETLLDASGKPDGRKSSDHLPVKFQLSV